MNSRRFVVRFYRVFCRKGLICNLKSVFGFRNVRLKGFVVRMVLEIRLECVKVGSRRV